MTGQHVPGHPASRAVGRGLGLAVDGHSPGSCGRRPCRGPRGPFHYLCTAACEHSHCQERVLGPVFLSEEGGSASDFESITFYTLETVLRVPGNTFNFF